MSCSGPWVCKPGDLAIWPRSEERVQEICELLEIPAEPVENFYKVKTLPDGNQHFNIQIQSWKVLALDSRGFKNNMQCQRIRFRLPLAVQLLEQFQQCLAFLDSWSVLCPKYIVSLCGSKRYLTQYDCPTICLSRFPVLCLLCIWISI